MAGRTATKRARADKENHAPFSLHSDGEEDSFDTAPAKTSAASVRRVEEMERGEFDEWVERKLARGAGKREKALEDRMQRLAQEKDEIQAQLDELRQVRMTAPEKTLEEVRKAAETRHRHDKEMINSLKARAEAAERRARTAENLSGSADRSMSVLASSTSADDKVRKELAEAVKTQHKLEEEVKHYKLKLEEEIAISKSLLEKAHLNGSKNGTAATASSGSGGPTVSANEDDKAVRKLYEDLTGLVITGVEMMDSRDKMRKYKAIFGHGDYHSLQFELEESQSVVEDGSRRTKRADLIYQPQLDDDRDRALLESEHVHDHWLESLRFERQMAFRFFSKLRNVLHLKGKE